jgi:hypothetical protein
MERNEQAKVIRDSFKNGSWVLGEEEFEVVLKKIGVKENDSWFSVFLRDYIYTRDRKVYIRPDKNSAAQNYLGFFIKGN